MVNVRAHLEDDTWWSECDTLPGWTVATSSWADLLTMVAEGMQLLAPGESWQLTSDFEPSDGVGET